MMKKVWVLFIALLTVAVLASVAMPAPNGSNLHGEYSFIGTRTCIQANLGADFVLPNYSLPSTGGSSRTTHYKGVLKLHGNGLGELSARAVLMNHNFGLFPTGQYNDESALSLKETRLNTGDRIQNEKPRRNHKSTKSESIISRRDAEFAENEIK